MLTAATEAYIGPAAHVPTTSSYIHRHAITPSRMDVHRSSLTENEIVENAETNSVFELGHNETRC